MQSGLEDRGVKLAAWNLTAIGGVLLMAAGSLRAQTPEMLPEPTDGSSSVLNHSSSSILQPSPPSVESWFESPHSGEMQSKAAVEGEHMDVAPMGPPGPTGPNP